MAKFRILLTSVLLVSLFFHSLYLVSQIDNMAAGYGDFIIFYTGAQILGAGQARQLYNLRLQKAFQDKFKVPIRVGLPLPYTHPPYELLLFLPLTYLSFPAAHAIWSFLSIVLLGLTLLLLKPFLHPKHRVLFSMMFVAFFPTVAAIINGQDSILTVFLFAGVFAALKQNRHTTAGSILAFGLYKPQLVFPMACFLLYKRCWRATTSFIVTGAALAGISIALVGWNGVRDYTGLLQLVDRLEYGIVPANMANIRGLLETVFAPNRSLQSSAILLLSSALLLFWSLYCCTAYFDSSNQLFDIEFSLILAVTPLTSYYIYAQDLTLLALSTILTLNSFFNEQKNAGWRSHFLQYIVLTLWFPLALLVLIKYRFLYAASIPIMLFVIVLAKEISWTRLRQVKNIEPAYS